MIEMTKEQSYTLNKIIEDLAHKDYVTLGGFAGTGKTFLISKISEQLKHDKKNMRIVYVAPTGRAAASMKKKLDNNKIDPDFVGTIHSLIYYPVVDDVTKKIIGWRKKREIGDVDLIVIDEASMVNSWIWHDLKQYAIKILAVGDHGQLYPVESLDDGTKFNLMQNPNYKLTQIHRQAEDNPIVKISIDVRNNIIIPNGLYNKNVFKMDWSNPECKKIFESIKFDDDTIVLCGRNVTRNELNEVIRKRLNFVREEPYPGEKIVCLSNNRKLGIMNGEILTLLWLMHYDKNLYELTVKKEKTDDLFTVLAYKKSFGLVDYSHLNNDVTKLFKRMSADAEKKEDLNKFGGICIFDFGYAISVHKSQGSSWRRVILFEERNYYQNDEDWTRWLYTGITRSEEKLMIIDDYR